MQKTFTTLGLLWITLLAGCGGLDGSQSIPLVTATPPGTTTQSGTATSGPPDVEPGKSLGRFTETGDMLSARAGHTATLLPNGDVLVTGGGQLDIDDLLVSFPFAETFRPSLARFVSTGSLAESREFHTATLLQNGKVLITGGNEFNGYPTWLLASASAELYDPSLGKSVNTGNMSVARTGHTASLLNDGRVLIVGGTSAGVPAAEIYDPATETFVRIPNPVSARTGHTATLLRSGKVLIVGGRDNSGALATAEVYDPVSNAFTALGSMAEARTGHTATLLPSGKVLIAGGGNAGPFWGAGLGIAPQVVPTPPLQTSELFDPQTGSFAATSSMSTARVGHTATLLADGTVLLCGGSKGYFGNAGYQSYDTAEIYDPATASFKDAGTLNIGRFWHTATLLPDGTVVLIGGVSADWALTSAEVFK